MMNKINLVIIAFLFFFSGVTCLELMSFSGSNCQADFEVGISEDSPDTFHHNHCREMESFHEDFFQQSDVSELLEIRTPSQKVSFVFISALLKYAHTYWHPPKQI
jgi:hypothetical protein